ncbi:hypothetical protein ACS0TY_035674 [Phlomoides rotata]
MGVEFEPSKEMAIFTQTGSWMQIKVRKVATVDGILTDVKKRDLVKFDISSQQVSEILESMVLENEIIEVKSTGLGD